MASGTVLLAEDEEAVREVVREGLQQAGYSALEARNGADTIKVAEKHEGPIHLMVTDVVMPGMSGSELANRLAAQNPKMKVLYMSGYTDDAIVHHGVLDGGLTFLQKPFGADNLARKLRELVEGTPACQSTK
jgi:DNA-binding NtrC family response regulator